MKKKRELLRCVPIFADLAADLLDDLAKSCETVHFARNETILNEGDLGEHLYILESGSAKVFIGNNPDEELVLFIMQEGDYVGDIALLDDSSRSASVVALESSAALCISKEDFKRLLDSNSETSRSIILSLTRRLREDNKRIRSLALDPVYRRLRDKLYELADDLEHDETTALSRKYSHRELGAMIGASRKMVGNILSDLIVGEYIEQRDGIIFIRRTLPQDW